MDSDFNNHSKVNIFITGIRFQILKIELANFINNKKNCNNFRQYLYQFPIINDICTTLDTTYTERLLHSI